MSTQITTAMVDAFTEQVIMIAQERGSKLQNAVLNDSRVAEKASRDRLGTVDLVQKATRHGDTPLTEHPHSRRWATPVPFEGSDLIDKEDEVRTIADFESPYAVSFGWAAGRRQDLTILQAANGTAVTGRDGSGTQVLPVAQKIAVDNHDGDVFGSSTPAGDVGLTVGKLNVTKEIMVNAGVQLDDPMDELHCAVSGTQLKWLLRSAEIASADFNMIKALVNGDVDQFMGFKFHKFASDVLAVDGASDQLVICWAKSGLWLNEPIPAIVRIDELPTKSYSTQIYMKIMTSAVRLDDAKVVEVACDPT